MRWERGSTCLALVSAPSCELSIPECGWPLLIWIPMAAIITSVVQAEGDRREQKKRKEFSIHTSRLMQKLCVLLLLTPHWPNRATKRGKEMCSSILLNPVFNQMSEVSYQETKESLGYSQKAGLEGSLRFPRLLACCLASPCWPPGSLASGWFCVLLTFLLEVPAAGELLLQTTLLE